LRIRYAVVSGVDVQARQTSMTGRSVHYLHSGDGDVSGQAKDGCTRLSWWDWTARRVDQPSCWWNSRNSRNSSSKCTEPKNHTFHQILVISTPILL